VILILLSYIDSKNKPFFKNSPIQLCMVINKKIITKLIIINISFHIAPNPNIFVAIDNMKTWTTNTQLVHTSNN